MAANEHNQTEFYVGYLPKAPATYTRLVRLFVVAILVAIPLIAFLLVRFQKGFATSTYDYANLTELTGVLIRNPFPALQINVSDTQGNEIVQTIPLVAFGKKGAPDELGPQYDVDAPQKQLSVTGNLIFYDGKTMLELKEWEILSDYSGAPPDPIVKEKNVSLTGEILDAKCFFGVMKPSHGKPHRSCAARCISGGIPPLIAAIDPSGQQHYYLITGPDYNPVNEFLLTSVAQAVTLEGTILQYQDWEVLQLNQESLDQLASQPIDLATAWSIAICQD
ncbi:MAG: hypothetical protein ACR2MX_15910 [Cyclobacteriaceae bacterium]